MPFPKIFWLLFSAGLEPRGTVLAQRLAAWKNLQDASTWDGMLSMYPEPQDVTKKPKTATTAPPVVGASSPTPPSVLPFGNHEELETPSNGSQPEVPPADEEEGSYGRLVQSPPASQRSQAQERPSGRPVGAGEVAPEVRPHVEAAGRRRAEESSAATLLLQ
ncbi:hypothetical protein MRX96_049256 [Rhipicephalus microplus]